MNGRRWVSIPLWLLLAAAAGTGIGYWLAPRASAPAGSQRASRETAGGPVASVKTIPLARQHIAETLVAYGTVVAAPSKTRTFSVPFECRVATIFVTTGEAIQTDTPLIEVEPSPNTRLQLDEARSSRDTARSALELVKQRLVLKLATRQDEVQAQQSFNAAQLQLESLERRGVNGPQTLRASAPGVVSQIAVQPGQIVAAGSPLLDTIGENDIVVRLGIENEDIGHVHKGQVVGLRSVNAPETSTVQGEVRLLTKLVNPQTRLMDVFVTPGSGAPLVLNEYVRGSIVVAADEAWVVPRAAVSPEEGRNILYTVEAGRAVKHTVTIGLENDQQLQVIGTELKAGLPVVVVGNAELQPGMSVRQGTHP